MLKQICLRFNVDIVLQLKTRSMRHTIAFILCYLSKLTTDISISNNKLFFITNVKLSKSFFFITVVLPFASPKININYLQCIFLLFFLLADIILNWIYSTSFNNIKFKH